MLKVNSVQGFNLLRMQSYITKIPYKIALRELGRTRFEKYKVNYKLVREANRSDQSVSLHYTPLYGPVPGFVVSCD